MYINKDELLELLEMQYGDLDTDDGCYHYYNGEYVWFSLASIVSVINDCMEYDEV